LPSTAFWRVTPFDPTTGVRLHAGKGNLCGIVSLRWSSGKDRFWPTIPLAGLTSSRYSGSVERQVTDRTRSFSK